MINMHSRAIAFRFHILCMSFVVHCLFIVCEFLPSLYWGEGRDKKILLTTAFCVRLSGDPPSPPHTYTNYSVVTHKNHSFFLFLGQLFISIVLFSTLSLSPKAFILAYLVYSWGNKENKRLNRKQPGQFDNE